MLAVLDHNELADGECGGVAASDETAKQVTSGRPWTTMSFPAEVDVANADQVRAGLMAALGRGCPILIVDMSRTTFCDCAGVRALLCAASQALRAGVEMRVVARARPVLRTFEITGLQLALRVYPTAADAVRGPPETAGSGATVAAVLALATADGLRRRQPADPC